MVVPNLARILQKHGRYNFGCFNKMSKMKMAFFVFICLLNGAFNMGKYEWHFRAKNRNICHDIVSHNRFQMVYLRAVADLILSQMA